MEVDKDGTRQRFYVELKPGETTIVSWKRLLKDAANKANPSPPPPPSSSVSAAAVEVETIHVLSAQQTHESQFALDEHFQVDKSTTKHNGFYANKGKLEHINEPISPTYCQSKKKRKNMPKAPEEKDGDHVCNTHAKLGHARMSSATRNTPLVEPFSSNSQSLAADSENHHRRSSLPPSRSLNDTEKQMSGVLQSGSHGKNVKGTREFSGAMHLNYQENNAPKQIQPQSKRLMSDTITVDSQGNNNERPKLPDLNIPHYPMQPVKTAAMHSKNGSSLPSKGTLLERAIRDLEKMVAEYRLRNMQVRDADDSSTAIKKRLPPEVKQKLAKVARLAQSSQGKLSEDLINRLMSILGHSVQLRTLKRNLREMVLVGLSAKQEKANIFQQIKKEVIEMIKLQESKQRDKAVGDFQEAYCHEEKGVLKVKYSMDNTMEDNICDLYDLYVQGIDEDKVPQIRKLYIELAELWPNGAMDNHGIKNAICRAKERRKGKAFYNNEKVQERRKTFPTPQKEDAVFGKANSIAEAQAVQTRPTTKYNSHIFASSDNSISTSAAMAQNLARPVRLSPSSLKGSNIDYPKQGKVEKTRLPLLKEQMKQQQWGLDSGRKKLSLKAAKEPHKSHKQDVGQQDGLSHQLTVHPPSCG